MLRFKPGVKLSGLQPQMALAATVVLSAYTAAGYPSVWVTSANDSKHKPDSFHYKGYALDFRLNDASGIPPVDRPKVAALVKSALGAEFDVLHESPGTPNEHLHVEYDPKG